MKKFVISFMFVVGLAAPSFAQDAAANKKLAWDQPGVTQTEANAMTYRYYPDGGSPIVLTGVTCAPSGSAIVCQAPFPAFTPGNHTLTLTAGNTAGESLQSTPLAFVFWVTPNAPSNVRIL